MAETEFSWWMYLVSFCIGLIIACFIVMIHIKNVYIDLTLTSTERKTKTTTYRLLSLSIVASIILYTLSLLQGTLTLIINPINCRTLFYTLNWCLPAAKMFMYLAFIIRLFTVYNNPLYNYNINVIKVTCITLIIYGVILCILFVYHLDTISIISGVNENGEPLPDYVSFCSPIAPYYVGGLIVLYDFIFNIGLMIAFINPIRKLVKSLLKSYSSSNEMRKEDKDEITPLINTGVKFAVLASVSSLTTFVLLISFVVFTNAYLLPLDYNANIICMILMTPYYNEKRYYERLCCGAIKCSKCCLGKCCGYYGDVDNIIRLKTESESTKNVPEVKLHTKSSVTTDDITVTVEDTTVTVGDKQ